MAVLAVAAAGAALAPAGIAFAGISYASIGWSLGMVAGQLLFPGSLPDQQGPRVGDLRAQQSSYGVMIPIVYGTCRIAGSVIWQTDLIETANTSTVGGKGTPSQTQTTYTYRVSMAVMLCEGQITGVRKIWASGKLIYNVAATADVQTVAASNRIAPGIAFYPGSTTQGADPTMQAALGAANVPAYRGRAYVVFSDFQLAAYGNNIPNFTFEVVKSGSTSDPITYGALPNTALYNGIATDGSIFVAVGRSGPGGVTRSTDGTSWSPIIEFLPAVTNMNCIGYGGGLWVVGTTATSIYTSPDSINWTIRTVPASGQTKIVHNGSIWVAVCSGTANAMSSIDGINWVLRTLPSSQSWNDVAWNGSLWCAIAANGTTATSPDGIAWTAGAIGFGSAWQCIASNGLLFVAVQNGVAGAASSPDGITWTSRTLVSAQWLGLTWAGSYFLAVGNGLTNAAARTTDGTTWTVTGQPTGNAYRGVAYAGGINVAGSAGGSGVQSATFRFGVLTPSTVALSSIVSDLATRAGLAGGDINVTALTDAVDGYVIGQQMSARAAIEPLQQSYYFDAVESDAAIAFRKRGGASVVTIPSDDLAAAVYGDALPDDLSISRQQEVELPARVSVFYINKDADYLQSTQQSQRSTTLSRQQKSVELAISLSDTKAKEIADVLMADAWTQRVRFRFRTSRKYAAVEPADPITVTRGAATYRLRVQRKNESRSGVIQWEAVAEEASVYTQAAPGGASVVPAGTVRVASFTQLALLDVPALRDQDNDQQVYAAACGVGAGWRGMVLYRSADNGASYDEQGALVTASAIGYATTVLGNFSGGNTFDELTSVTVQLYSGSLSSASALAVLNGANAILIGTEVLQFKNATLVGTNTYTLTGFLRGRKGSEPGMSTHALGDRVVALSSTALRRYPADYNAARTYKPVSIGRTVQETPAQAFTYSGVNLKPLAPVQLGGGRDASSNATITWVRRTRIGGDWNPNVDASQPEATESYEIEIWSAGFAALRRTLTSSTPTVAYSAAQQTADSIAAFGVISIRVYQISAAVGRGYVLQGTL